MNVSKCNITHLNDFELECLSSKIIFQSKIEFATLFAWFSLVQIHVHQRKASILPKGQLKCGEKKQKIHRGPGLKSTVNIFTEGGPEGFSRPPSAAPLAVAPCAPEVLKNGIIQLNCAQQGFKIGAKLLLQSAAKLQEK